jgi:hypothetical protein
VVDLHRASHVRITPRISCEAVSPSVLPTGAQGGTSACSTGAVVSFVSCIRLLGRGLEYSYQRHGKNRGGKADIQPPRSRLERQKAAESRA